MARVLGVSRAGYYAWAARPASAHAEADAALLERIRTVHSASREIYGAPRVHAELRAGGERHGRKRIARLMREAGMTGVSRRRGGPVTTRRDPKARPAPDLVDRDFSASGPNRLWVTDITLILSAKSHRQGHEACDASAAARHSCQPLDCSQGVHGGARACFL
ncbi:IS3 family transposase [Pseudoroseomonas ludipueritiae]